MLRFSIFQATFGESVLHDNFPRDSTVVTITTCELLRVQKEDFRLIWEVSGRTIRKMF